MTDEADEAGETSKKKRHRLHLHEISSIGAVAEADNPLSDIVFWKSRDRGDDLAPAPPAAEGGNATHRLSWRSLTAAGKAAALEPRLAKNRQSLSNVADHLERLNETMGQKATIAPADTVRGTVDRMALEMMDKGEAATLTEARVSVWKARPDLVLASRAEGNRGSLGGKVTPEPGTLPERIAKAVHARAVEISALPQYFDKTAAERRVAVWETPDGRRLRELYTTATKKRGKVEKSATSPHAAAFETLAAWETNPADGLR